MAKVQSTAKKQIKELYLGGKKLNEIVEITNCSATYVGSVIDKVEKEIMENGKMNDYLGITDSRKSLFLEEDEYSFYYASNSTPNQNYKVGKNGSTTLDNKIVAEVDRIKATKTDEDGNVKATFIKHTSYDSNVSTIEAEICKGNVKYMGEFEPVETALKQKQSTKEEKSELYLEIKDNYYDVLTKKQKEFIDYMVECYNTREARNTKYIRESVYKYTKNIKKRINDKLNIVID